MLGLIGIAACIGHIYPIFFHFNGGKGVATAIGAIAPIGWDLTGMLMGTWLTAVFLFRYSSLAALITALVAPFYTWLIKLSTLYPLLCCAVLSFGVTKEI